MAKKIGDLETRDGRYLIKGYSDLDKAKTLPMTSRFLITPEAFKVFLTKTMQGQLVRVKKKCKDYEAMLLCGDWTDSTSCIGFTEDYTMMNGVHRGTASVASGVPLPCRIALDVDDEAFERDDQGGVRTLADMLKIAGIKKNAALIAATSRIIQRYKRKQISHPTAARGLSHELRRICFDIETPVNKYASKLRRSYLGRAMTVPYMCAFLSIAWAIDSDIADQAFNEISENCSEPGSALHSLSKKVATFEKNTREYVQISRAALFVECLNAFKEGQPVGRLKLMVQGKDTLNKTFPVLWGVQPEDLPF